MSLPLFLGIVTPVLPVLGSGALLSMVWLFLIVKASHGRRMHARWAAPWLVLLGAWAAAELAWYSEQGLEVPGGAFPFALEAWPACVAFLRATALALLVSHFSFHTEEREAFWRGLEMGLAISALAAACIHFAPSLRLPNQSDYFLTIGRFAGTFSDPNAWGVFLACAIPVLAFRMAAAQGNRRRFLAALLTAVVASGAASGSRSFVLGLSVALLIAAWRKSPRMLGLFVLLLFVALGTLNTLSLLSPQQFSHLASELPEGIRRALESCTIVRAPEAWFSRLTFWRIGIEIWMDNFFFGVGLQRFPSFVVSYARELGLPLQVWSDNANSFYLGILAEMGILGGGALLWSISRLEKKVRSDPGAQDSLWVLVVLLLVGPHLDFDEVMVLAALLLAGGFGPAIHSKVNVATAALVSRGLPRHPSSWSASTLFQWVTFSLLLLGLFLRASVLPFGFYPWELEGQSYFRWTRKTAQLWVRCDDAGRALIVLRSLVPDASNRPQRALISAPLSGAAQGIEFGDNQDRLVALPCSPLLGSSAAEQVSLLRIEVNRTWSPLRYGLGSDGRDLGLQLRSARP